MEEAFPSPPVAGFGVGAPVVIFPPDGARSVSPPGVAVILVSGAALERSNSRCVEKSMAPHGGVVEAVPVVGIIPSAGVLLIVERPLDRREWGEPAVITHHEAVSEKETTEPGLSAVEVEAVDEGCAGEVDGGSAGGDVTVRAAGVGSGSGSERVPRRRQDMTRR